MVLMNIKAYMQIVLGRQLRAANISLIYAAGRKDESGMIKLVLQAIDRMTTSLARISSSLNSGNESVNISRKTQLGRLYSIELLR